MPSVFITVAERSADQHAAGLVRALRSLRPDIQVDALGGDALRAAGATVHHDTVANAAMGLAAFKRYGEVKRLLAWTDAFYAEHKPDLHVCCDSWTMNKHFARLAKKHGVKVLYYISPQVWASREGRVREMAELTDGVACLFPFEEPFLRDRGVNATFVGHPLFDEMMSSGQGHLSDPAEGPTIALPCGSRAGVARANFPRQLQVAERIRAAIPNARFVVPTTPATQPIVAPLIADKPWITAELDAFDELIAGSDLAITVSGTATLHIAAHGVPMIVVYAASPLAWHAIGRWMIRIRTFAMVNLLANGGRDDPSKHIVPEFVPWHGSVEPVANAAIELLRSSEKLAAMRDQVRAAIAPIAKPGASDRVARLALELMGSATA